MNALAIGLQVLLSAVAHPGHVSMAEAEYVGGKLEVALQVNWQDLDIALEEHKVSVEQLLKQHFVLRHASGKAAKIELLGSETQIFDTWLYFEVKLDSPLSHYTLENSLFMNQPHGRQINTVQLKSGESLRTFHFTSTHPRSKL